MASHHVLTRGHKEMDLRSTFWLEGTDDARGAQRCSSTTHVEFHHFYEGAGAGLDVVAAAVKGQALAYQRNGLAIGAAFGRVLEVDELGGLVRALSDTQEQAHIHGLALLLLQHLQRHCLRGLLCNVCSSSRHVGWIAYVGRSLYKVPGDKVSLGNCTCLGQGSLASWAWGQYAPAADNGQLCQLAGSGAGLGLEAGGFVACQQHA
mmetsp:Transcript_7684/g.20479  ORF Transcript_7684/g.20479 Transcript_7684/m.20479 type:complete len:206 (+) Transcript_7684:853-1470(+)